MSNQRIVSPLVLNIDWQLDYLQVITGVEIVWESEEGAVVMIFALLCFDSLSCFNYQNSHVPILMAGT